MESYTLGLIAQLKGSLNKDRYRCSTVYVDHVSRHSYVYLQHILFSNETYLSKKSFEAYSQQMGIEVQHYHYDNGRFVNNLFQRGLADKGQSISHCAVNAHVQNRIAEKRMRDLQDPARKTLIHAQTRWPEAITANLWPYAIRNANNDICMIADRIAGTSKYEKFAQS